MASRPLESILLTSLLRISSIAQLGLQWSGSEDQLENTSVLPQEERDGTDESSPAPVVSACMLPFLRCASVCVTVLEQNQLKRTFVSAISVVIWLTAFATQAAVLSKSGRSLVVFTGFSL